MQTGPPEHALARVALILLLLVAGRGVAVARDIGIDAFDPPMLDGVETGLKAGSETDAMTPFVFGGGRDWPAIRLHARQPLDWSDAGALGIAVDNPGAEPFELLLRIDDRPDANGDDRSLTGIAVIAPQAHVTVLLPLDGAPLGMRGQPPSGIVAKPGDLVTGDVRGTADRRHVVALHISGVRTPADRTLLIGSLSLRPREGSAAGASALADRFGQALDGIWPEKVGSDAELRQRLAAAASQTRRLGALNPAPADRWGGLAGPTLAATGVFRTARIDGRWTLVTPAGHAFFSLGVDAVQPTNPTLVDGREALFQALPAAGDPLARYYGRDEGRRTFDIGAADLERGLGRDWARAWTASVVERLKAWGFNTLGNWSVATLATAMPHVVFYDVEGASATVPMGGGRDLVDPFDPAFPAVADAVARAMTAGRRSDAGLIGYFSGNELPWGEADRPQEGVAAHVLALAPDSPARTALMAGLRDRYDTPAAVAAAWGVPHFDGWEQPLALPGTPTRAALRDIESFEARFADRYFSTVAAAIRRHDPDHLYLGTRFASFTPAAVRACARWCDVLSFNVYGRTPAETAAAWRGLDRPVLIGEFHFGSLDRGSFWPGMIAVDGEAQRGPAYAAYLAAAARDPAVIGCHWYQYADEPLTGRPYDGENGHIGLVAVTDVPFGAFVDEVAAANRRALADVAAQLHDGR